MSDLQKAVNEFQKLSKMFESFTAVGQALARVASIENAEQEALQRTRAAQEEADAAMGVVRAHERAAELAQKQADSILERAHVEAADLTGAAEIEARKRVEAAAEYAATAKVNAEREAQAIVTRARGLADIEDQRMREAKELLLRDVERRDAITREIEELENRLTAAKAEAQRIMERR